MRPRASICLALILLLAVGTGCATTAAPPASATSLPAAHGAPVASAAPASVAAAPASAAAAPPAPSDTAATARVLPPRPDRPPARVVMGVLGTTYDVMFYLAEERGYFEHMR